MNCLNRLNGRTAADSGDPRIPGAWVDLTSNRWLVRSDLTGGSPRWPEWNLCEGLQQSLTNLGKRLIGKHKRPLADWESAVPIDPKLGDDLKLLQPEIVMQEVIPHMEAVANSPRGHLKVEESREPVSRASRVSPRSVMTLASRSEDWQSRTLLGVRPRRVLTELLDDQWDTYENRVLATLRERILGRLRKRLDDLNKALQVLEEANENSIAGSRLRQERLYEILGEIFTEIPGREELEIVIHTLEKARARLLALEASFLYQNLRGYQKVQSPLHGTNTFQSDPHYRRIFHLWRDWERYGIERRPTAEEVMASIQQACDHMNDFVRLLCIRACRQLDLLSEDSRKAKIDHEFNATLVRGWNLQGLQDGSLNLELNGHAKLRIIPLCVDWRQLRKADWMNLNEFADRDLSNGCPVLLVGLVGDGEEADHDRWNPLARQAFEWRQRGSLLADGWGIASVSPTRIVSTETIAQAIRWVIAESEWPSGPISEEIPQWRETFPELKAENGVTGHDQELKVTSELSESVMYVCRRKVEQAEHELDALKHDRDGIKDREKRSRGKRGGASEINRQKKKNSHEIAETEKRLEIQRQIESLLSKVRSAFLTMKACPCCRKLSEERLSVGRMISCDGCGAAWGWKTCHECHQSYTVIKPKEDPSETTNLLRFYGMDLCSPYISGDSHDTASGCPRCQKPK